MLNRFRILVACALTFALCWVPGFAFAGDAEDGAQVAATAHGLSYGIEGFERLAKGTARAMEGQPEGYRFPVDEDVDLVACCRSRCSVDIAQSGREVWIGSAGQRVRIGSQGPRL